MRRFHSTEAGARDVIPVSYINNALEIRIDEDDLGTIRNRFRMISKIIVAVSEAVRKPQFMCKILIV